MLFFCFFRLTAVFPPNAPKGLSCFVKVLLRLKKRFPRFSVASSLQNGGYPSSFLTCDKTLFLIAEGLVLKRQRCAFPFECPLVYEKENVALVGTERPNGFFAPALFLTLEWR